MKKKRKQKDNVGLEHLESMLGGVMEAGAMEIRARLEELLRKDL